jgi:hypothetical protein
MKYKSTEIYHHKECYDDPCRLTQVHNYCTQLGTLWKSRQVKSKASGDLEYVKILRMYAANRRKLACTFGK